MPPKRKPKPEAELAVVRRLTDELDAAEEEARKVISDIRARRNRAMVVAKAAGATGEHLGEAARMNPRNAFDILNQWRKPNAAEEN